VDRKRRGDAISTCIARMTAYLMLRPDVRFGSKADIREHSINVRFTPESGHPTKSLIHPFNERRIVVGGVKP